MRNEQPERTADGSKSADRARRGFSLVELVVASGIGILVVLGIAAGLALHARACLVQKRVRSTQENVRAAMELVCRDVRMAGYGMRVPDSDLSSWITWVSGIASNPCIVQGATASAADRISVVAALDTPLAALSAAAPKGGTTVRLAAGQGALFNTTNKKVIYLGRTETVRILAVSGDQLTISTHPTQSGVGLRYAYPAGASVELVKVVTYSWSGNTNVYPRVPRLMRDDHLGTVAMEWQKTVASDIEDFQVADGGRWVALQMVGRTAEPDDRYVDPVKGDHYRRVTVRSTATPRNLLLVGRWQ